MDISCGNACNSIDCKKKKIGINLGNTWIPATCLWSQSPWVSWVLGWISLVKPKTWGPLTRLEEKSHQKESFISLGFWCILFPLKLEPASKWSGPSISNCKREQNFSRNQWNSSLPHKHPQACTEHVNQRWARKGGGRKNSQRPRKLSETCIFFSF